MVIFLQNGHLSDEAISALIQDAELDELTRLEIAEHLSYCDACLQRYTEALSAVPLLTPAHSCRESLWRRIRQRTVRILTSRYATAAAAVALALTLVWADIPLPERSIEADRTTVTEKIEGLLTGVTDFLNGLELPGIGGNRK